MKKLIGMALVAWAANGYGATMPEDTFELQLGGKVDFTNPQGKVGWALETGLGYFVFDNIAFGGILDWGYDGNDMGFGLGGFGEFNLDLDTVIMPYIAMRMEYCFGDYYRATSGHDYVVFEPAAGLKFFLSESIAIYTEAFVDLATEKAYRCANEARSYDAGLHVGLRCYF